MPFKKQILGVSLGNALTDQFSSTKSSTVGLNWEFHHKTKTFFELHMLYPLFQELATKLHSVVSSANVTVSPLLQELLVLSEKILNWEFESTITKPRLPGTFGKSGQADDDGGDFDKENGPSSVQATASNYPKEWLPVLGNNQVIWLYFMVCMK
jgi:hypothetical protein